MGICAVSYASLQASNAWTKSMCHGKSIANKQETWNGMQVAEANKNIFQKTKKKE